MAVDPDDALAVTLTSTALLAGLRDPGNQTVWRQYVERYRPLVVRYAVRVGVPPADAEDVAQTSLVDFARGYAAGQYDRARGRLRSWLFGIVSNRVRDWRRTRPREVQAPEETRETGVLERLESPDELEAAWEAEWRDAVLAQCLAEVRREVQPATYEAFELFAVQGLSAEEVAERTGLTPNAVYGAKRRVLRRVRELQPVLEDTW